MQGEQPTVEECISLGKKRMQELIDIRSCATGEEYFARLGDLSWMRVKEVIDHPITDRGGFHLAMLEFVSLLEEIVINQRGPGILGLFSHIELNFSPRVGASYDPLYRIVRLNLGLMFYVNELEAIYQWLDSVVFKGVVEMPVDEISRIEAPSAVQDEFTALLQMGKEGGLPVSKKHGLTHPIGLMLLRFVIAHELAHLIDLGGSPKQQAFWRETVWSDYDDVLDYGLSVGWLTKARYNQFRRPTLDKQIASRWANEFVADGLGFYTLSKTPPGADSERRHPYSLLETAVEIFFHSLVAVYQGDVGTDSHPPPTLRSFTIRAGQRKLFRISWEEFLADYWGAGIVTSELIIATMRKVARKA